MATLLGACSLPELAGFGAVEAPPAAAAEAAATTAPPPTPLPTSTPLMFRSYQIGGVSYRPMSDTEAVGYAETGTASWYGADFNGNPTANGEIYDMYALSAAHKTLPLPCYVRVTNLVNGNTLVVRVNDRGPFKTGRVIDLSYGAAQLLDMEHSGLAEVRVEYIGPASDEGEDAAFLLASLATPDRPAQAGVVPTVAGVPIPAARPDAGAPIVTAAGGGGTTAAASGEVQAGVFQSAASTDQLPDGLMALGALATSPIEAAAATVSSVEVSTEPAAGRGLAAFLGFD